jgi:lipid-binding SYLF domain-containing protein
MITRRARLASIPLSVLAAAFAFLATQPALAQSEQQKLVDECLVTWNNFQADPNLTWFREHDHEAVGFLIAAQVVKAGFIFGGSGGRAVLVAKGDKGWAGPAFYTMGTASVGFQAGVSDSEVITLVMNKKALESLMSGSVKAGADASVAAGPVGVGAGTKPNADFLVFTRAKGLYGGVDVNGAVIKPTEDWNKHYYGKLVSPIDIVIRGEFHNPGAAPLVKAIETAMAARK